MAVRVKSESLAFSFFDVEVQVTVTDPVCKKLLLANYGFFQVSSKYPVLSYVVNRRKADRFLILRGSDPPLQAHDDGDFLFLFEKDLTIELQKVRPALYFVHAAVLEYQGKGLMLIAASGGGKSTTTWALCHHGFRYLSDELGPVDVRTLKVVPYPHALNLKEAPPSPTTPSADRPHIENVACSSGDSAWRRSECSNTPGRNLFLVLSPRRLLA